MVSGRKWRASPHARWPVTGRVLFAQFSHVASDTPLCYVPCVLCVIPASVGISMGGGERSAQSSVSREGFHERRHSRTPRFVWTCHPCPCSPLRGQGRSAPRHLRVPFHVTQSREYLSPVHIGTFAPFFPLTTGTDSRSCPS